MRNFRTKILTVLIVILCFSSFGVMTTNSAFAADAPTDLSAHTYPASHERLFANAVCNDGTTDVISLSLSSVFTNYAIDFAFTLPPGLARVNATDPGTFDESTGVWTGLIKGGECMAIGYGGHVTGADGETIVDDFTILSSVLGDSSTNDETLTSGNNTAQYVTSPISPTADIAISTRLLTSGTITTGSQVSYEVTIKNVGLGEYIDSPSNDFALGLYFLLPGGSTLNDPDGIVDQDTGDGLTINGCNTQDTSAVGPGIAIYPGKVAGCSMSASAPLPAGSEYKFIVNITAGSSFTTGSTGAYAVVIAEDPQSMLFQVSLMGGAQGDVFAVPNNNWEYLVYDSQVLQTTVARCPGQGATTSDGTGCLRVSFSKKIYAPSFQKSTIVLSGGGTVDTLTQLNDYTWEVHIVGIPQGATTALTLLADQIVDYSAVQNGVSVLGENTIRFGGDEVEVTTSVPSSSGSAQGNTTAAGTLATTGSSPDYSMPLMLLFFGLVLTLGVKFKKKVSDFV